MNQHKILSLGLVSIGVSIGGLGCGGKATSPGLINSNNLSSYRGLQIARVHTHFHSPISFDACDGLKYDNTKCLHDLKKAVCTNHVNITFLSDHTDKFASTEFAQAVQLESGDTVINNSGGAAMGNQIGCSDGFSAILSMGFEGAGGLMAIGMESHAAADATTRTNIYDVSAANGYTTTSSTNAITTNTNGIVGVQHTEKQTVSWLTSLSPAPSFIEIYNVHANIAPGYRQALGFAPFQDVAKVLNFFVDPFGELNPDFFFAEFVGYSDVYMTDWNALIANGAKVAGVAGLDSHENAFPIIASDGERLDSHRRMTRFLSNYVLTSTLDIPTVRASIAARKVYVVLEGLGTPTGMDFNATAGGTTTEMGGTASVGTGAVTINFTVPTLHSSSFFMSYSHTPILSAELHFINTTTGAESVVATASSGKISYPNAPQGAYRVHVKMQPLHLEGVLFTKRYAATPFTWVITNPIWVGP